MIDLLQVPALSLSCNATLGREGPLSREGVVAWQRVIQNWTKSEKVSGKVEGWLAGGLVGHIRRMVFIDVLLQKQLHVFHIRCIFDFFLSLFSFSLSLSKPSSSSLQEITFSSLSMPLANRKLNFPTKPLAFAEQDSWEDGLSYVCFLSNRWLWHRS